MKDQKTEHNKVKLSGLTGFLVRKVVREPEPGGFSDRDRTRIGMLEGWGSVIVNLILTTVKLVFGIMINSASLIADAVHSFSDLSTSAIVIFGFKFANKPPDKEHPFGHANAELVASLIMSVLLTIAGFELLKSNALTLIKQDFQPVIFSWVAIVMVLLTIVLNEWLTHFSLQLSRLINSGTLKADAWHHRIDSITSLLVVFSIIGSGLGYPMLDSGVGILVSLVVIWSGVEIGKDSISPLLGQRVDEEVIQDIHNIAMKYPEVSEVHDILVHQYVRFYFISLHAVIPDDISLIQSHDIADKIQQEISKKYRGECIIHIDPVNTDCPRYQEVAAVLGDLVKAKEELIDFHDLHFRHNNNQEIIKWEFSVNPDIPETNYGIIEKEVGFYLSKIFTKSKLLFSLEPGYHAIVESDELTE